MTLQQKYERFLAAPSAAALDAAVGLHYITTTISVNSADSVIKHLASEEKKLKRRKEKVLSAVESGNSLVLEVETEIEFKLSGGSYLPELDTEFVADHIVLFPIAHFVAFEDGLIKQVRQFWDMSSLLKQIGVIGRSGRNWPIREGKDQIKFISKSLAEYTAPASATPAPEPARTEKTTQGSKAPQPREELYNAPKDGPETPVAPSKTARRDNQSQFEIADDSPAALKTMKDLPANRKAGVKGMGSDWNYENDDTSDGDFFANMSGEVKTRGITIAGNGMGMRKGVNRNDRSWGYNDTPPSSVKKESKEGGNADGTNSASKTAASSGVRGNQADYKKQTQKSDDFYF